MTTKKHAEISYAEEAQIQKMIAADPDSPELTDDQITSAKPFAEAFPEIAQKMRKNVGGRPKSASPNVPGSIRLDQDVVTPDFRHFEAF